MEKKGPIAWMSNHPVTANLLMTALLLGGFVYTTKIKKEFFPDFATDTVKIHVSYPGASPSEVEQGIILAIEEAVSGLEEIDEIKSYALEGRAKIFIDMREGEDLQKLANDIQTQVDRITSLPGEAEKPVISIMSHKRYVVSLALYGDLKEITLRQWAEYLRDKLLEEPEISQVELSGIRDYEISMEIPGDILRSYGLTLEDIAKKIRMAAVELPAGAVKTRSGDVLIRMKERRDFAGQFGLIPIITAPDGTRVLLEDMGKIKDGFEDVDLRATYNGKPAIMFEVYRVGKQTPVMVSESVKKVLARMNKNFPPGLKAELINDRADIYKQRLGLLLKNGYLGLGLVFILLALFLEIRLALWVSLGIPISFMGSLFFLPLMDVSINMVSMFAFIITLGIVVDDAIVVGENIYSFHSRGFDWPYAAVSGTHEIIMPITFSVLTNMVAFMPMFFVPGFMGKVFRQIPVVVISVFTISLIESIFILPSHIGHSKERNIRVISGWIYNGQQKFSRGFLKAVNKIYAPFLNMALEWRYLTVCIGLAILFMTMGFVSSGKMGFVLFPKVESDFARAVATLPFGSAFEKTKEVEKRLVKTAGKIAGDHGGTKLVRGIFARSDANKVEVRVYLTPPEVRPISTSELVKLWRKKFGIVPGLESIKFQSDAGGPGHGAAIAIELAHKNTKILENASHELATALGYYPLVKDIDDGFSPGKKQIDFKIKPEAQSMGFTSTDVARQIRHAFYGAEALRQQRGRDEVRIMVRLPFNERNSEYSLENMILRSPKGKEISLVCAIDMTRTRAYTQIVRHNGRQVVTVTADVLPRSKTDEVLKPIKDEILPHIAGKYPGLTYGFEGRQAERRNSMKSLIKGLGAALVIIFAMLAIPLNSYVQPFIIMTAIPFGIVGAITGHLIMGYSLSILSMFGIVALAGVVVNDSLVLIDFANKRQKKGLNTDKAICEAAIHRFRPVILTTLTTFGGLGPMIFETSRQARFLIPMAISLGFGVLFATMITLFLVPCLYVILEDFREIFIKRA